MVKERSGKQKAAVMALLAGIGILLCPVKVSADNLYEASERGGVYNRGQASENFYRRTALSLKLDYYE